jgi:flagella basal body P-ring formation protein FlgA
MITKVRTALAALVFSLSAHAAAYAAAVPYSPPTMQVVSGARLQSFSDVWAHGLVKDASHSAILAYPVSDQRVVSGRTEFRASTTPMISPDYASLPVEIRVDGTLVRTVYIGYRIVTMVKMPVLGIAKRRGDVLAASDFRNEMRPADGRQPVNVAALVGRILNADYPAGAVVYPEVTSVDQIVKAGSPVVLIVHDGSVALAADVIARTGGGLGEMVTVYDEGARKMLSGLVTAPSRVELTLPEVSNQ